LIRSVPRDDRVDIARLPKVGVLCSNRAGSEDSGVGLGKLIDDLAWVACDTLDVANRPL